MEWLKANAKDKVAYDENGIENSGEINAWIRLSFNGFTTENSFGEDFISYGYAKEDGELVYTDIPSSLTIESVDKAQILEEAFKKYIDEAYVYDVLGLYDITPDQATQGLVKKLFNNNLVVDEKNVAIGEGEGAITMDVLATLSYQLPSDVLTAPNKYFGTSQEIVVKIQSEQCVIEKTIKVYFLDRSVKKLSLIHISEPTRRS